ncbi:secondary thiamine-phosphate synthase enzyme YjbQ [Nanoarchaeota archaeon]
MTLTNTKTFARIGNTVSAQRHAMQVKIKTSKHQEMVDITSQVNEIIAKSNVKDGICNVFALHATAAIIINENYDPNICDDCFDAWNKAMPKGAGYRHDRIDGNAQSHIIAAMLGPGETIPVRDGKLLLGTWQSLMLVELDGPKERKIEVSLNENLL